MSIDTHVRTRTVANAALHAGNKIITSDGVLTVESDAEPASAAPATVFVDVAAGTLYLPASQASRVLVEDDADDTDELDEEYLMGKGYPLRDIELFSLGLALGRGRGRGVTDADTISWFCLTDADDRDRLVEHTGCPERQLQPTPDTALAFIQSYGDGAH
ncbi:hypothetical protein [Dietzia maris]|uniref:hypothetical protein n=1 Tax=Dietzia maris TaxID=37915 RepID=UPI0037CB6448